MAHRKHFLTFIAPGKPDATATATTFISSGRPDRKLFKAEPSRRFFKVDHIYGWCFAWQAETKHKKLLPILLRFSNIHMTLYASFALSCSFVS